MKVGWDEFHRWNKVHQRSTKAVGMAANFFQLLRDLENVFGFGQGRLIDRQAATFAGESWLAGKAPGGTREFVYLAGIPERFLQKWRFYYEAVDMRREHSEANRTGHDRFWWVDLGHRLGAASAPVFALLHSTVYRALTPHVLFVQKPGSLPDARARSLAGATSTLKKVRACIQKLHPWMTRLTLLAPYWGIGERGGARAVVQRFVGLLVGKQIPGLAPMFGKILGNLRWHGKAVCITHV